MKKLFLVLTVLVAASQPVAAIDLVGVYKLAVENDPAYRAAQATYQAALESKSQSRAGLLPQLNLSAHYTDNDRESTGGTLPGNYSYNSNGYTLSLTQPLFHKENFVAVSQADAQIAQASAVFDNAKQDLILRVATQYFEVLSSIDDLAFAQAEVKAISEQLLQTKQRFNVGLTAITDVHEAQARYDQAVASEIAAQNTYEISRENLREITGQDLAGLAALKSDHPLVAPDPQDIQQWVKTALDQNALLTAANKGVDVANDNVRLSKAGHYPTLDLVANHTSTDLDENAPGGTQTSDDTSVSLQLNIPLYSGGLTSSRTRQANFLLQQARENLEQQRRATERLTRTAYLGVIANISQVKALKQALASSRTALEATQAGFEVGTRTAVDVLDSQRELYRAERDYARSRYNYLLETLRLKLAAGNLTEEALQQINPWLK